ncbi:MAG: 30S ribosomal protein S1 [Chloroflexi bacterium]|nr:30S ribosomal protein S1 [Chloroflexota bacterium]
MGMETGARSPLGGPLDDGYWEALFHQGEEAAPIDPEFIDSLNGDGLRKTNSGSPRVPSDNGTGFANGVGYPRRFEQEKRDWEDLRRRLENSEILLIQVIGFNKGGLLVRIGEVDGFVPASQLCNLPRRLSPEELQHEMERRVGKFLNLKIVELDATRDRLILSERATTAEGQKAAQLLEGLTEGQVCMGKVRNVTEFGAFIDLGGVDGLVHISEMSWGRVDHPSQILEVSQEVKVYIMSVDYERKRIALSLKRLYPDPWSSVEKRYSVGQLIQGEITNVVDFGAFARLEEGLEGLVHISELAEGSFLHPRNVVREGDIVTVRVLHIDSSRHRLALSLRQVANPDSEPREDYHYPPDSFYPPDDYDIERG